MNGEQVTFMVRTENITTGDQQLDRHLLDFAHRIHHFRGDSASNGSNTAGVSDRGTICVVYLTGRHYLTKISFLNREIPVCDASYHTACLS
ncbi:uncharacterized protein ARMOST_15394 [Armillaria ostoyae]|uniref:Uncharacterized protein n=1 Tax=Armillaria ostoyae TaxID=47428 RepID=A0A284RTB1_ARMOS|nr:uncharacterized protein ARMOST_15394 [Armillaria ostoyae]